MKYEKEQCEDMLLEVGVRWEKGGWGRSWTGTLGMGGRKPPFLGLGALKQVCQTCGRVPGHTLGIRIPGPPHGHTIGPVSHRVSALSRPCSSCPGHTAHSPRGQVHARLGAWQMQPSDLHGAHTLRSPRECPPLRGVFPERSMQDTQGWVKSAP